MDKRFTDSFLYKNRHKIYFIGGMIAGYFMRVFKLWLLENFFPGLSPLEVIQSIFGLSAAFIEWFFTLIGGVSGITVLVGAFVSIRTMMYRHRSKKMNGTSKRE